MSNLEKHPAELVCDSPESATSTIEILQPREVPLGGPRAMPVRRTLPQRSRSLIGAWCFVDHYGPNPADGPGGMTVPPHPHTGLQTVSWLFAGDIEHRDSTGSHAMVRPGELNLMTAGHGIAHSEVSTGETTVLHGAQLWIALPDGSRDHAPFFEHYLPRVTQLGDATLRVFLGSLAGDTSSATTFTELLGAQLDLPAGASVTLDVDPRFEHGVLLDAGELTVETEQLPLAHLAYVAPGRSSLTITAGAEPARALVIGGVPLGESIVMWWNFIGRNHDEIVGFRDDWMMQVIAGTDAAGRFGHTAYDGPALPAPELPTVRLRPRE
ncbi:pirin family protein [soil metagenome]